MAQVPKLDDRIGGFDGRHEYVPIRISLACDSKFKKLSRALEKSKDEEIC